jgi:hypothetical protein
MTNVRHLKLRRKQMTKVYLVTEVTLCDDPYYAAPPATVAVYASIESAQANVDAHVAECKRMCEQDELDEERIWECFPQRWVLEVEVQP